MAGSPAGAVSDQTFGRLREQIAARVREGTLREISAEQIVVNLMALCLFPFAAQPMLRVLFGSVAHQEFSRERKAALTRCVLDALCPPTAQEG